MQHRPDCLSIIVDGLSDKKGVFKQRTAPTSFCILRINYNYNSQVLGAQVGTEQKAKATSKLMKLKVFLTFLMVLFGTLTIEAQQKLKFSIASFELDPFDTTPQNKQYEKIDGSGFRYAIIKVTSTTPDDNLKEYNFNFGNLKSIVEQHDNELWVYVQKNAKLVTISREGYTTLNKYDLKTTIDEGKVYVMLLNAAKPVVYTQMVQFVISPASAGAVITVKSSKANAQEEMFGTTDATGSVAKALQLGTYTYKVIANNYHLSEGRFTLSDRNKTHKEMVTLRSNVSEMTFNVDADADIYINGEFKGKRTWTGVLRSGEYQVECRQADHHNSSQYVTVTDNNNQTITLSAPTPITGTLALTSKPLGGHIMIDGMDYGVTPQNINDLIIGNHHVTISLDGYKPGSQGFNIQENQTTNVHVDLQSLAEKPEPSAVVKKPVSPSVSPSATGYIQAAGQAGTMMGFGANAGAYISNFNVEAYITMAMSKESVPMYNTSSLTTSEASLSGMIFGIKLGYGIKVGSSARVTPQVGVGALNVSGDDVGSSAVCATVGARVEIGLGKNFGISLTPEGQFAASKKDVFKQLEEVSNKIKGWGTGANLRVGLYVKF